MLSMRSSRTANEDKARARDRRDKSTSKSSSPSPGPEESAPDPQPSPTSPPSDGENVEDLGSSDSINEVVETDDEADLRAQIKAEQQRRA